MAKNFLFNPRTFDGNGMDPETARLIKSTIDMFEHKGLREMKMDDVNNRYCDYFVKHQRDHKAFARMLTPTGYGSDPEHAMFDLRRITEYNECLSFYNLACRYIFQVSLLGLGPIWMSDNEHAKKEAARILEEGGVFGFGCSEKTHGADLYSNEMCITETGDGRLRTDGEKYYIGNSDRGHISTFARFKDKDGNWGDWAWVLADSMHPHYNDKKHIKASYLHTGYVGEYYLVDYPTDETNLLTRGQKAWEDALSTVNIGKFQVGVSPIGVATHAFYECLHHSYNRWLYGKRVTDMPHVRKMFVEAYLRTVGMRLYAFRAIDYFKHSSETDRRYLLFNPINKMKASMEGVTCVYQLFDAVTARGFEAETYMEQATRDIQSSPRLEGTAHVNLNLIIKFINGYFFHHEDYEELPVLGQGNDDCVFHQMSGRMASVTFSDYRKVYGLCSLPNVRQFSLQTALLRELFETCAPSEEERKNMDYMLNLGHMFTMVPYGQLILEAAGLYKIEDELVNELFVFYVTDMARYALNQFSGQQNTPERDRLLRQIMDIRPVYDKDEYERVWTETIEPLNDAFIMNEY